MHVYVIPNFVIGSCFDFQKLSTMTKLLANTAIAHTAMSPTKQRMSLNRRKSVKKIAEKDVLLSSNNRPVMKKYITGQLFELNKTSFSVIFLTFFFLLRLIRCFVCNMAVCAIAVFASNLVIVFSF